MVKSIFVVIVVDGLFGHATAPASVYPGNPWSIGILGAHVIMGPETGRLYHVTFSGGDEETITVDGKTVRTRHYVTSGDRQANIWYDENDIPVKFSIVDEGNLVICTLASMSPPSVAQGR